MKKSEIIEFAISKLTDTEKEIFVFLTDKNTTKESVVEFLNRYDIDNKSAEQSFLINHLVERFSIKNEDSPPVSRIKGLKEFFRFHNVTELKNVDTKKVLVDTDLCMKVRFPEDIRPLSSTCSFITYDIFGRLFGKMYAYRISKNAKQVKLQNKTYLIPDGHYMEDILYLGLYIALIDKDYASKILVYVYDVYRYCDEKGPGLSVKCAKVHNILKKEIGKRIKWLLKLVH